MPTADTPRKRARFTAMHMALLIKILMEEEPSTYEQLCSRLGLGRATVSDWLYELRRAKLVRIAQWRKDARGCHVIAAFQWNPEGKPDAKRIRMSGSERMRRVREKKRMMELIQSGNAADQVVLQQIKVLQNLRS